MSDRRLRDLDRRFRATGSVEDQAALLGERLRAGDLLFKDLYASARLGHPAANVVFKAAVAGDLAEDIRRGDHGFAISQVVEILWSAGRVGIARALQAAVRLVTVHLTDEDRWIIEALDAVAAWESCPCKTCKKAVRNFLPRFASAAYRNRRYGNGEGHRNRYRAAEAVRNCVLAVTRDRNTSKRQNDIRLCLNSLERIMEGDSFGAVVSAMREALVR